MTTSTAQMRAWRTANPGYDAAMSRRRRAERPEDVNASNRKYRAAHRESVRAYHRAYRKRNRERLYFIAIKSKFGVTREQYEAMFAAQHGTCALCSKVPKRRLCVDHDHATGAVRALLCTSCNSLLGKIENDMGFIERALAYLRIHEGKC